jgi:putative transposase
MPFIKVYIHFVWSTKNRVSYLNTLDLRKSMWKHIKDNSVKKDIFIDYVNGYNDHCHCLISLGVDQTISKVMQLVKGESAHWFNKSDFIFDQFEWQDEYFAVSVSESNIERVRNYIKNQEAHHYKKSYQDEFQEMIEKFGFQQFNDVD